LEFWGDINLLKLMEWKKGEKMRLKTKGNSILIDQCSQLKLNAQNYSGEDVLGGWTYKIKTSETIKENFQKKNEIEIERDDSQWE
jgi:hypothetical protein